MLKPSRFLPSTSFIKQAASAGKFCGFLSDSFRVSKDFSQNFVFESNLYLDLSSSWWIYISKFFYKDIILGALAAASSYLSQRYVEKAEHVNYDRVLHFSAVTMALVVSYRIFDIVIAILRYPSSIIGFDFCPLKSRETLFKRLWREWRPIRLW